jgi:hypothetical protein
MPPVIAPVGVYGDVHERHNVIEDDAGRGMGRG